MQTTLRDESIELIEGNAGVLEIALYKPTHYQKIAIICHPHPLQGGTMFNKVVTTLIKTYQSLHFMTIRFNFRGIGQSAGQYDQGRGELADLFTVMDIAKQQAPDAPIYLAGFSFGAFIAIKAACVRTQDVAHLVTVAPPVTHVAIDALHPVCPWILVQGDQDEIISPKAVYAFAESRKHPPQILRFPKATHFFHGQLTALQEQLSPLIL